MVKDFWKFLKDKCKDCYELNKNTKPHGEPIFRNDPQNRQMLIQKYCEQHLKELVELSDEIRDENHFCPVCEELGDYTNNRILCPSDDCRVGSFFTA